MFFDLLDHGISQFLPPSQNLGSIANPVASMRKPALPLMVKQMPAIFNNKEQFP
jgi:hypothetical protein